MLPDPRGQAHDGSLICLETDLGEFETGPADAVADLVVEGLLDGSQLDRDTEDAQLLLVPVEHPVEGLVTEIVVALDRLPDLRLRDEGTRHQQTDREVHQPL